MLSLVIFFLQKYLFLKCSANWVHGQEGNVVFSIASAADELNTDIQTLESTGLALDVIFSFEDYALTQLQVGEFLTVLETIRAVSEEELVEWSGSFGEYFFKK